MSASIGVLAGLAVVIPAALLILVVRAHSGRHDWSNWRRWNYSNEGAQWILSEPQVRERLDCGLKQRLRWWRR